jgi:hypothetical protein
VHSRSMGELQMHYGPDPKALETELNLDFSEWIDDGLDGLFSGDIRHVLNVLSSPTSAAEDEASWTLNAVAQAETDVDQFETSGAAPHIGVALPYTPSAGNYDSVDYQERLKNHGSQSGPSNCVNDTSAWLGNQSGRTYGPV